MNGFFTKITGALLGLTMAIGVGVAMNQQSKADRVDAATDTFTFTSKAWADSTNSWTSTKDGGQLTSGRGVQVTKTVGTAGATSKQSFTSISRIEFTYSTNANAGVGSISVTIGSNTATTYTVTKTGGTTDRTTYHDYSTAQTGAVSFTVTCTTNSIYIKSITITTSGADADYVLNKTNNPFSSTSGSNTATENKTVSDIAYTNYGGYLYNTNYLSFNRNINGYIGNHTSFPKNISSIVINYNSGGTTYCTMYEGASTLAETTTVSPSTTGTGYITYTFSDTNPYFKFKLTTTGTYVNIVSISIYLGSDLVGPSVSSVTISGDMTKKSYTTVEEWDNTGLSASVTMSDASQYSDDILWEYSPVSPAAYTISNDGEVTNGSVTATASAVTKSDSETISGINVSYATVAQGIAATPSTGTLADVIVKGVVSQVISVDTSYKNANYYISADGTTSNELYIYRGRNVGNTDFTDSSEIQVGDEVLVYGGLTLYNSVPQFGSGNYILSLERDHPSIDITESDFTMIVGGEDVTLHETHTNMPSGASINWVSETTSVATINASTGVVHAVSAGSSIISAQILDSGNNVLSSNSITVSVVESPISDGDSFIIYYGETGSEIYFTGVNSNNIGTYSSTLSEALVLTAVEGSTAGQFALRFDSSYLSFSGSENKIYTSSTNTTNATLWNVTNNGTYDIIESVNVSGRHFKYNTASGSERFCCYTSESNIHIQKVNVVDPTTLSLNTKTLTLEAGEDSTALTFTTDSPSASFHWYSEDTSKATVSSGVVHGVASSGTVKIYVYFDTNGNGSFDVGTDLNDYCTVTLTPAQFDYSAVTFGGIGALVTSSNSPTTLVAGKKIILATSGDTKEIAGNYTSSKYYVGNTTATTFSGSTVTIGDGTEELTSLEIFELETATGGFYLKNKDGKYLSHSSTTTSTGDLKLVTSDQATWTISVNASGEATINGGNDRSYIRVNKVNDENRFKSYANSTGSLPAIYSFVEYTDEANEYATAFMNSGLCGSNDDTKASGSIWATQSSNYNSLSAGAKYLLSHAAANASSAQIIEQCLARYDRVIYLHYATESSTYNDFMNRVSNNYVVPLQSSNTQALINGANNTNVVTVIAIMLVTSITTIGGYFFIRKRKAI